MRAGVRQVLFNQPLEVQVKNLLRRAGGSLYVPSPANCYQESTGITPCTEGSPVGFVRDLVDSKNLTQSTTGFKPLFKQAENILYHDRVDDKLTVTVTASTNYRIITASDSGISDYVILSPTSGVLAIPAIDFAALALIEDSKVTSDLNIIKRYFATKIKSINPTSILRLRFSTAGAKTLEIIPASGANAIFSWSGGIDQNDSFAATVSANDTVELKTVTPNLITQINLSAKSLYGQIPSLSANTALAQFYCHVNQLTGGIPSLSANTALTLFVGNTNQLTGGIPSLSANTALAYFQCSSNQLTGWLGGTVSETLGDFQAQHNLLTQSAVDRLLAAFDAAGRNSGTRVINIGGTGNASPSAAGLVSKSNLLAKGWTVTTN